MWRNKQKQKQTAAPETPEEEPKLPYMNIRNIFKEIEYIGSAHSTWKERKEMENRKAISLGGKPQKKQRFPLSVARAAMKNQKKREERIAQEDLVLGRFKPRFANGAPLTAEKHKPENRVLKSTEGNFRNGVLDVKHLMDRATSREDDAGDRGDRGFKGGKRKGGGKKSFKGKKKGGGKNQGGSRGKKRH